MWHDLTMACLSMKPHVLGYQVGLHRQFGQAWGEPTLQMAWDGEAIYTQDLSL